MNVEIWEDELCGWSGREWYCAYDVRHGDSIARWGIDRED